MYLLTPWSRVLLEKLTDLQLVKKLPVFYGTRRFITAFTSARHPSLSWANSIQSIPLHPTSWRSVLILSSHLRLGLPSGLFPSCFPTKTLYTPLFFPVRATCAVHLVLFDFITCTVVGEEYRSWSSLLWSFLHTHIYIGLQWAIYTRTFLYPIHTFLCNIFISNSIQCNRLSSIDFGTVNFYSIVVALLHKATF
jgi:hypothetical protein